MDALKKHNAPAAFFVVGNMIETAPDIIRRMVQEGHIVGNHTCLVYTSTGDVLRVETGDHRPPKILPTPGNWPLPIVWEDGHLLVINKPAGMTAHASNFLPDTPTVAGALAYTRGTDFIFHSVNRLDKGTTGLMVVCLLYTSRCV